MKREYQTFFLMVVLFTAIEVIGDEVLRGRLVSDSVWVIIFSVALVLFVIVRILWKKTKGLNAQGR